MMMMVNKYRSGEMMQQELIVCYYHQMLDSDQIHKYFEYHYYLHIERIMKRMLMRKKK